MYRMFLFVFACLFLPGQVLAQVDVLEGEQAEKLYEVEKEKAKILVQQNKIFILRIGEQETPKPESIKVKAGERFYITNEEHSFVHNVYDMSDSSWVLKKQEPSKVAAIAFHKPGIHKLRCAIHPTMKTELHVVP